MYDRVVDMPRLVCAYRLDADALPEPLAEIAACMHSELAQPFYTIGLNYHRDGQDSVAPHNDKLETLVPGRPIAVLSLGATRRMTILSKQPPGPPIHIDLEAGSVLVMSHLSQLHFDHGIPKKPRTSGSAHQSCISRTSGRAPFASSRPLFTASSARALIDSF